MKVYGKYALMVSCYVRNSPSFLVVQVRHYAAVFFLICSWFDC